MKRDPRFEELDALIVIEDERERQAQNRAVSNPAPAAAASIRRRTRILAAGLQSSYETRRLAYLLRGERWAELRVEANAIREREARAVRLQSRASPLSRLRKPMASENGAGALRVPVARREDRRRAG